MHSPLHRALAQARAEELRRDAARSAGRPRPRAPRRHAATTPVTLRFCFPDDSEALARLALLDSSAPPPHPALLAEVAGELRAALSLADGSVVSDPFYPSADIIELLHARARQLTEGESRTRRRRLRWRAGARVATWR